MNAAILADFSAILAAEGVSVSNATSGATFRAIVTSSNQDATFTPGDQTLQQTRTATCPPADCPQTGDIVIIEGEQWRVNAIQSRQNSPIRRFTLSRIEQQ